MTYTLKQKLGAAVIDWPRYEWHIQNIDLAFLPVGHWTRIRNRRDRLEIGPEGRGVKCAGRWTSHLHVANVFASLGARLMRTALDEWPVERSRQLPCAADMPEVSFVIGHRGRERLAHLLLVLETIAGQRGVELECVIVDQSQHPATNGDLPSWVRLIHTPPPEGMPYSRSWAFNVGARHARGELLVFHDNDLMVSAGYAQELRDLHRQGWEVINLKRFIFYLSERETKRSLASGEIRQGGEVDIVLQNARGGSLGVDRASFFDLGGFDEAFIGWGGEDNEFWERSRIRRVWPFGFLPLVHLWHPSQPGKATRKRNTARLLQKRSSVPPEERVAELVARDFGRQGKPDPVWPR